MAKNRNCLESRTTRLTPSIRKSIYRKGAEIRKTSAVKEERDETSVADGTNTADDEILQ